jgi:hypothetical protein
MKVLDAERTFSVGRRNDAGDIARMRLTLCRLMALVTAFTDLTKALSALDEEHPCLQYPFRTRRSQLEGDTFPLTRKLTTT